MKDGAPKLTDMALSAELGVLFELLQDDISSPNDEILLPKIFHKCTI